MPFWSTILPSHVVRRGCSSNAPPESGACAAVAAIVGPNSSGAGAMGMLVELSGRTWAPHVSTWHMKRAPTQRTAASTATFHYEMEHGSQGSCSSHCQTKQLYCWCMGMPVKLSGKAVAPNASTGEAQCTCTEDRVTAYKLPSIKAAACLATLQHY